MKLELLSVAILAVIISRIDLTSGELLKSIFNQESLHFIRSSLLFHAIYRGHYSTTPRNTLQLLSIMRLIESSLGFGLVWNEILKFGVCLEIFMDF